MIKALQIILLILLFAFATNAQDKKGKGIELNKKEIEQYSYDTLLSQGSRLEPSKTVCLGRSPETAKILEQLSIHGFQECGLFFACQRPALPVEPASGLSLMEFKSGNTIEWQELSPASHDNNGSWQYFFVQTNAAIKF